MRPDDAFKEIARRLLDLIIVCVARASPPIATSLTAAVFPFISYIYPDANLGASGCAEKIGSTRFAPRARRSRRREAVSALRVTIASRKDDAEPSPGPVGPVPTFGGAMLTLLRLPFLPVSELQSVPLTLLQLHSYGQPRIH